MKLNELLGDLRHDVQFCGIQAVDRGHAVVLAVLRSLEEKRIEHAFFLTFEDGDWSQHLIPVTISSFCVPKVGQAVGVTPSGMIVTVDRDGHEGSSIDPTGKLFNRLRNATEIIARHDRFYVSGMGREICVGTPNGNWERLTEPLRVEDEDFVGGFLSCDVSDNKEVYAVGFGGEIWRQTNGIWHRLESLTDQRLTKIRNTGNGILRACGANGVLLEGIEDKWSVVDHAAAESSFWDMAVFADITYVCSSKVLLAIDAHGNVDEITCPIPMAHLSGTGNCLWVVGTQNIACFDGSSWTKLW